MFKLPRQLKQTISKFIMIFYIFYQFSFTQPIKLKFTIVISQMIKTNKIKKIKYYFSELYKKIYFYSNNWKVKK